MIAETTINLYPIFKLLSITSIIAIVIFLLHNLGGLKLFSRHDQKLIDKFMNKYPDVTEIFCKLPLREQNIENNQEIHELNQITEQILKRLDAIEKRLK